MACGRNQLIFYVQLRVTIRAAEQESQFKESDDVGRSRSQDVRRKAKTVVKSGYGDKGDQKWK
jgi:hypothetical protein